MSSAEEDYNDDNGSEMNNQGSKKRRVQRACDICRRKKIRCDGGQMPGNKCSNCIAYNYECTYIEAAKKRGPPKGYVEGLENRLEKMEKLLSKLAPDGDFTQELGADKNNWLQTMDAPTPAGMSSSTSPSALQVRGIKTPTFDDDGLAPSCDDDDDFATVRVSENLRDRLQMDPMHYRFFGKSSSVILIQTAIDLKNEYVGNEEPPKRPVLGRPAIGSKRPEFWNVRPWELANVRIQDPNYDFPDDDLMVELVDLYFAHVNLIMPTLHRPTFERGIADGIHRRSTGFGGVVLLVCAIGSRYCNDPRVFLPDANSLHSAGWKWFDQVYGLSVLFLHGSSAPQACWTMVGIGVRLAQDVGAHRRKMYTPALTVEDELWKRAFWCLVTMDRFISSILGRPCAIQDEDFDLDFPLEVDDEYWEDPDPEKAFKQPPNKPSKITFFVLNLKLNQIQAFALRTIYSINKSKVLLGFVGQTWEQHIVAELDSALNKWIDAVPDHLRWDPNRENLEFFNQSTYLHASFYHLQILIHRPFIPSPRRPSPLSFPSLAICTNAARSCSHVVDIQRCRTGQPLPFLQVAVFTAGIVLLLNIWGGRRSGLSTDPNKELADVHKCMSVLKIGEKRFHSAGRLWDVLCELASVGEFPLPKTSPAATNKRGRGSDSPLSAGSVSGSALADPLVVEGPRTIVGSKRASSKDVSTLSNPASDLPTTHAAFTLPLHSGDLGRLPLHGQFDSPHNNSPPFDPGNDSWYTTLRTSVASIPPPNAAEHRNAPEEIPPSTFAMDHIFLEHLGNGFSASFPQYPGSEGTQYPTGSRQSHYFTETNTTQQQNQNQRDETMVDNDTIAMWSNAPTGFELEDWGTYMSELSNHSAGGHGQ